MARKFWHDEKGATAIEYGLIAGLIFMVIVTAAGQMGSAVDQTFQNVGQKLAEANQQ
ncbi:Flp family type IVb pilin [Mesorhizobium xinjiangense]|uniref:Flp family type IVb pilin n=1 Tax=Mesorhizobium xinjiangense TaxID=2678685 RepID=UPI0012ECCDE4|nr:Flp family type IVb pilin [Mesorhizobium xinjiangense]